MVPALAEARETAQVPEMDPDLAADQAVAPVLVMVQDTVAD